MGGSLVGRGGGTVVFEQHGMASGLSDKGRGTLGQPVRASPTAATSESEGGWWSQTAQGTSCLRMASVELVCESQEEGFPGDSQVSDLR